MTMTYAEPGKAQLRRIISPQLSCPAPTIQLQTCEVSNLRPTSDGLHIVGEIRLAGEVSDTACDYLHESNDPLPGLALHMNGNHAPLMTIPVMCRRKSELRAGVGSFVAEFDTVLPNVNLSTGWNSVRLKATNPCGFAGSATASFQVAVAFPADVESPFDFHRCTISVADNDKPPASGGGVMSPFAISIDGPENLLAQLTAVQIGQRSWSTLHHGGNVWLTTESNETPSMFIVSPQPGPRPCGFGLFRPEPGASSFSEGFAAGLVDTGIAVLELTSRSIVQVMDGGSTNVTYRFMKAKPITETMPPLQVSCVFGERLATTVKRAMDGSFDRFRELILGTCEPLAQLGDHWVRVGLVTAEIWDVLKGKFDDMEPYQAGWICGRAFGEALALVRSGCNAAGVESNKLQLLQPLIARLKQGL